MCVYIYIYIYIYIFSVLNIHWKNCCWSWNSNIFATWCEELTHWKSPWSWERLKAAGEGDEKGWDGWMASLMWWTWSLGVGDGHGSVVCWSPWVCKESAMTEQLNWTDKFIIYISVYFYWPFFRSDFDFCATETKTRTMYREEVQLVRFKIQVKWFNQQHSVILFKYVLCSRHCTVSNGYATVSKTDNFLVFWDLSQAKVIITECRLQQYIMNIIIGETKDVLEVYHTID